MPIPISFVGQLEPRMPTRWSSPRRAMGFWALFSAGICAGAGPIHDNATLPFSIGERLTYQVSVERAGKVGKATMWVEGPIDVRGTSTYLLRFDSQVKIAFMRGVSRSSSWFDPLRGSSLRYSKHERNPVNRQDESVDIYPEQKRWKTAAGAVSESPGDIPLDELSFMYFIRTLPLTPGAVHRFDRHFDVARNPITVRMIRREMIPTPMGELRTLLVEMRVRDARHYKGEGIILIHLTDDACRVPARIQSEMPVVGTAVLTIASQNTRCGRGATVSP